MNANIDIRLMARMFDEQVFVYGVSIMSIKPRAELPGDMKDNYHFGEI